jgi:hypothetical protein
LHFARAVSISAVISLTGKARLAFERFGVAGPWARQGGILALSTLQVTESQVSTPLADERQTSAAQYNETGTTAQVVSIRRSAAKLECCKCGAMAETACNCGAPYVPAGDLAAKAVAANPDKSDRTIAAEIGVGKDTVRRARKSVGANAPTEKRVGKDGKSYKARKPTTRKPKPGPEPSNPFTAEAAREAPSNTATSPAQSMADAVAVAIAATNRCLPSGLSNAIHAGDVKILFFTTELDKLIELLTDFRGLRRKVERVKQTGGLFDSNH